MNWYVVDMNQPLVVGPLAWIKQHWHRVFDLRDLVLTDVPSTNVLTWLCLTTAVYLAQPGVSLQPGSALFTFV